LSTIAVRSLMLLSLAQNLMSASSLLSAG
jgi:hypothetical protein